MSFRTALAIVQALILIAAFVIKHRAPAWPFLVWVVFATVSVVGVMEYRFMRQSIAERVNMKGLRMRHVTFSVSARPFTGILFYIWLVGLNIEFNWYPFMTILALVLLLEWRRYQILKKVQPVLIAIIGNQLAAYDDDNCLKRPLDSLVKISDSKFYFSKERSLSFDRADFDQDELIDFFNAMIIRFPNVEVTDQMQALLELRIVTKTNVAGGNDFNVG
jgi:hypothetical protein